MKMTATMSDSFIQGKNNSVILLSYLGFETPMTSGQEFTPPAINYEQKALPPIPRTREQSFLRPLLSDQPLGGYEPKEINLFSSQQTNRLNGISKPTIASKFHVCPESRPVTNKARPQTHTLPLTEPAPKLIPSTGLESSGYISKQILCPTPPPPKSKSAQKILQLTGLNLSLDQRPKSHDSVSLDISDDSSGSLYSQPEDEAQKVVPQRHSAAAPTNIQKEPSVKDLQSWLYSASEGSASNSDMSMIAVTATSTSVPSLRYRDRPVKQCPEESDLTKENFAKNLTNEESMAVQKARFAQQKRTRLDDLVGRNLKSRHDEELTDAVTMKMVRTKFSMRPKSRALEKNSTFERRHTTSTFPTGFSYDDMPSCSRRPSPVVGHKLRHKTRLGTVNRFVKTSSVFNRHYESETRELAQTYMNQFSRTIKRLSGGIMSPIKHTIPKTKREAGEPDTSHSSGFRTFFPSQDFEEKRNERSQVAVDKEKRDLRIQTADERRREQLKKQIVVIGITDQSPGA